MKQKYRLRDGDKEICIEKEIKNPLHLYVQQNNKGAIFKSKKAYSRKQKHKKNDQDFDEQKERQDLIKKCRKNSLKFVDKIRKNQYNIYVKLRKKK